MSREFILETLLLHAERVRGTNFLEEKMEFLDCTLRDGGYYTNWDFSEEVVDVYLESVNELPIDYLEIGYRSKPMKDYLGEYFYLPINVIERIKKKTTKKLVIILNEKDVRAADCEELLKPCIGLIDMVRIAIDPVNIKRSLLLAEEIKSMGFLVGFNVMYMSTWKDQREFLSVLPEVNGKADYFYMVDSFGGVFPEDVRDIYELISKDLTMPIGFHGHNNLELALVNTLTAIECGVSIVDATITGMGRGAGNLKTELFLTVMNSKGLLDFDYNHLANLVDAFSLLQDEYGWGTNLPYMVSGANSLPQKEVMDWVGKRYFSFNSIIRALHNQSRGVVDNIKLPTFNHIDKFETVLIVGGGPTVNLNINAIHSFLKARPNTAVIHASSKNALQFKNLNKHQFFCLVGNEGHRMEKVFSGSLPEIAISICPPYPRKMGTYIPESLKGNAFELSEVSFSDEFVDSHTSIALETAIKLGASTAYVIGYDGYGKSGVNNLEQDLFNENEYLFERAKDKGLKCISLTATKYKSLESDSVFAHI